MHCGFLKLWVNLNHKTATQVTENYVSMINNSMNFKWVLHLKIIISGITIAIKWHRLYDTQYIDFWNNDVNKIDFICKIF